MINNTDHLPNYKKTKEKISSVKNTQTDSSNSPPLIERPTQKSAGQAYGPDAF
jgi:hypothetical protein